MGGLVLSESERDKVVKLRENKVPRSDVAKSYSVCEATISRITAKFERTGDLSVTPPGRGTEETDGLLDATKIFLEKKPKSTLQDISDFWKDKHGVERSKRTVGYFLKAHGLESDYRKREDRSTSISRSTVGTMNRREERTQKKETSSFAGFLKRKHRKRMESKLRRRNLDRRIKLRLRALLRLNEGHSVQAAAAKVGVSGGSVRRWHKMYVEQGLDAILLKSRRTTIRCKLKFWQLVELFDHVNSNPRLHVREIRFWIYSHLNVKYSISGVRQLIMALGFKFKRSRVIPRVPDADIQKRWVEKYEWRRRMAPEGSIFVYVDAVHPRHRGDPGGCWVLADVVPAIQQASGRLGANVMAALNPDTGEVFYVEADKINGDVLIKLMQILKDRYKDAPRIYVILDNAGYHKSKAVKAWLKSQPRTKEGKRKNCILLFFIPPYCPHLNKIERLWRMMRKHVTENKVQENLEEFLRDLREFLDSVEQHWDEYKDYVDAKFRIIDAKQYQVIA